MYALCGVDNAHQYSQVAHSPAHPAIVGVVVSISRLPVIHTPALRLVKEGSSEGPLASGPPETKSASQAIVPTVGNREHSFEDEL